MTDVSPNFQNVIWGEKKRAYACFLTQRITVLCNTQIESGLALGYWELACLSERFVFLSFSARIT